MGGGARGGRAGAGAGGGGSSDRLGLARDPLLQPIANVVHEEGCALELSLVVKRQDGVANFWMGELGTGCRAGGEACQGGSNR